MQCNIVTTCLMGITNDISVACRFIDPLENQQEQDGASIKSKHSCENQTQATSEVIATKVCTSEEWVKSGAVVSFLPEVLDLDNSLKQSSMLTTKNANDSSQV